jgi:hypothetical protein
MDCCLGWNDEVEKRTPLILWAFEFFGLPLL